MGQQPAQLTPLASAHHFFGAELRHWRQHRSMSLAQLGRAVHVCGDLIGKIEKAQRWADVGLARKLDATLESGGILERLLGLAEHERTREPDRHVVDVTALVIAFTSHGIARDGSHAAMQLVPNSSELTAGRSGKVVPISSARHARLRRRSRAHSDDTVA